MAFSKRARMQGSRGPVTVLIVLPTAYNPDESGRREPVEDERFQLTMSELGARFGGGMLWRFGEGGPRGYWWDRGILFEDDLAFIEVDVPDTSATRRWLRRYAREVLIPRFQQKAIYLKLIGPVEVLLITVS